MGYFTETEYSKIITIGTGLKTLLAVQTTPVAGLGLVLIEMDMVIQRIKELI